MIPIELSVFCVLKPDFASLSDDSPYISDRCTISPHVGKNARILLLLVVLINVLGVLLLVLTVAMHFWPVSLHLSLNVRNGRGAKEIKEERE